MTRSYRLLFFKKLSTEGLTLVEVIVGMLISAIFLGTALQAYVSAVSIKAKAQQSDVVISTIHADSETIRQISQEIPTKENPDACTGNLGQKVIEKINAADTKKVNGIYDPNLLAVNPIVKLQDDQVLEQTTTFPIRAGSKNYQFRRVLSTDADGADNPSRLVYVSYEVTTLPSESQAGNPANAEKPMDSSTGKSVTKLRTAVMPNAVLVCP